MQPFVIPEGPTPFHCVEQMRMAIAAAGLPLQITQLAGGRLQSDLQILPLGTLRLLRVRLDRPVHVRGTKNPALQLVCLSLAPSSRLPSLRSHGHLLAPTAFCGLAAEGEVHITLPAGASVGLLMIEREVFRRSCLELGCEALAADRFAGNCLTIDGRRFEGVRRVLLAALASRPVGASAQLVADDLMPLLLEALIHATQGAHTLLRPPARIAVVMEAQRWMEHHPGQPLSLSDLCQRVHVSRRSLIQGFRDHLGMGPIAFLRLQRLHAVRQELLLADPQRATVFDVASRYGFHNHGHFAAAYRHLFGEPPAATLRLASGQGGISQPTPR
ncbi:MAG: helix-turn-helix domain-containing protein [Cyanobacteriota bacterium]|nr:helix-turn-helix domain-containing protein [Cyanobacteriota bacterium]